MTKSDCPSMWVSLYAEEKARGQRSERTASLEGGFLLEGSVPMGRPSEEGTGPRLFQDTSAKVSHLLSNCSQSQEALCECGQGHLRRE